jgi:adenylate cyclase
VGVYDLRVTPFSNNYPGLGIHANIIDSIISRDFLQQPGFYRFFNTMAILFSGIILGLILTRLGVISGGAASLMLVAGYSFLCLYLFAEKGIVLNMTYPIIVAVFIYSVGTAYKYFVEASQKRFIKDAFSTYLAPTVVEQLIESPEKLELGGEQREITAFFSDIQGFTSISEKLSPPELVELLNEFLTEMTDIILKYEGTVDKFEGDAIIAFFGAPNLLPNHAETATIACIEMQKKMEALRNTWRKADRPELNMRIGVNSGPAVVGNMGSKNKMDYTMMGDTVNTAARLEGVNKIYGTYTLIGEMTFRAVGSRIFSSEIDTISVVGKDEPFTIYEPIGYNASIDENVMNTVELYSKGLKEYRAGEWRRAVSFFQSALDISADDAPSRLLLTRCRRYMDEPPLKNWNGIFKMTDK